MTERLELIRKVAEVVFEYKLIEGHENFCATGELCHRKNETFAFAPKLFASPNEKRLCPVAYGKTVEEALYELEGWITRREEWMQVVEKLRERGYAVTLTFSPTGQVECEIAKPSESGSTWNEGTEIGLVICQTAVEHLEEP